MEFRRWYDQHFANPSHTYYDAGAYKVSLTVTGPTGTNTISETDFIRVFSAQMRIDVEAFITRFYQLCLDRQPDETGLNNWISALLDGKLTGGDVGYGFVFSQEFLGKNTSDEIYLNVLYEAFFNRQPDETGLQGWMDGMQSGAKPGEMYCMALFFRRIRAAMRSIQYKSASRTLPKVPARAGGSIRHPVLSIMPGA